MSEILWKLSVPVTAIVRGPFLKVLTGRQYQIRFSLENEEDGSEEMRALLFHDVEAFKCTHMKALHTLNEDLRSQSYGAVISIFDSSLLHEVKRSYSEYSMPELEGQKELRHLMITFDDGPCYEFICTGFSGPISVPLQVD